jgi:outer membrane protein assembly factor BamB
VPGTNVDLRHVRAYDDDGTLLWDRDVGPDGEDWKNARFKWIAPNPDGRGATILLTDDGDKLLYGLSAEDGSVRWSHEVSGPLNPSNHDFKPLVDGDLQLPVLFSPGEILVVDPVSGDPILDAAFSQEVSAMPSWHIFDVGGNRGFLTFGEDRSELRMLSLSTGEILWTHSMERVQDVIPLADGTHLMAIWDEGVQILDASGNLVSNRVAPGEIRKRTEPVYADLNGDGTMEFLFVSDNKNIVAWRPETGEHLWTGEDGKSLVGAANPIQIYDAIFDMDDDGWLDIPIQKPSGAGVWVSGRTGEALAEVGNGTTDPIVGDFDGDADIEIFWAKKWYDIVPTEVD